MAIEYRTVDAEAVEENVLRNRALEAETAAFQQEMEVKRLQALLGATTNAEEKSAINDALTASRSAASSARARSGRLGKNTQIPDSEVKAARRQFLQSWISSLEQEHVAHTVLADQRRASLATTDENAPGDDERKRIEDNLTVNEESIRVIETSWNTATAELDALEEEAPVEPTDPAPAEPVTPAPAEPVTPAPVTPTPPAPRTQK